MAVFDSAGSFPALQQGFFSLLGTVKVELQLLQLDLQLQLQQLVTLCNRMSQRLTNVSQRVVLLFHTRLSFFTLI